MFKLTLADVMTDGWHNESGWHFYGAVKVRRQCRLVDDKRNGTKVINVFFTYCNRNNITGNVSATVAARTLKAKHTQPVDAIADDLHM